MRLTKHHGLGNDFLVTFDDVKLTAELARQMCDRRRGIGADGLIVARPCGAGADLVMELRNSDGSIAAMSGNGIRCLAQAAVLREEWPLTGGSRELAIRTAAGMRSVTVTTGSDNLTCVARVGMGPVRCATLPEPTLPPALLAAGGGSARAMTADIGNPHIVVQVADPFSIDLARFGPELEANYDGGINVEFIAPVRGANELNLSVWERGAGITEACGTGASAAAFVAARWGLVSSPVLVHLPGGDVMVEIHDDEVWLTGPAAFVGSVEVGRVRG